tara:strand:- start:110 stop:562 length:453 start_codon:yes stop_codon:yes gene_type:complete
MLDNIFTELIFEINKYLNFKDKNKLGKISKKFNKIQIKNLNYHCGDFLKFSLGISENDDNDMKILRNNKLYFLKEICKILLNDYECKKKINSSILPLGKLIKINNYNLDDCKNLILNNKFKLRSKSYKFKDSLHGSYFKRNFYLSYSLLI